MRRIFFWEAQSIVGFYKQNVEYLTALRLLLISKNRFLQDKVLAKCFMIFHFADRARGLESSLLGRDQIQKQHQDYTLRAYRHCCRSNIQPIHATEQLRNVSKSSSQSSASFAFALGNLDAIMAHDVYLQ